MAGMLVQLRVMVVKVGDLKDLQVEFKAAGVNSLDYLVYASMDGNAAAHMAPSAASRISRPIARVICWSLVLSFCITSVPL